MPETPLGQIVSIRAEKDAKTIQKFTKDQKKIRNDWIKRKNKKLREDPEAYNKKMLEFQQWAKATFS